MKDPNTCLVKEFEHKYPTWVVNAVSRIYGLLNENFRAKHGLPLYKFFIRKASKASKPHRPLPLLLAVHHNYMLFTQLFNHTAEDIIHRRRQTERNQPQTDQEALPAG